ncbi:MAG: FixH family protein [Bacteroidetes bacterium]|nr:MAG: FixH family protein [Bacteroidota bacterium]
MKKFHWGHGIVLSFIIFGAGLAVSLYIAFSNRIELVSDDYYERGLSHQRQMQRMADAAALDSAVSAILSDGMLIVTVPRSDTAAAVTGMLRLFRPSDGRRDIAVPIALDGTGRQRIPVTVLEKGLWRLQVDWTEGGRSFYHEQPVVFP